MKNLLFTAFMLFVSGAAIAQLYVKPNGSTDSYIYVDDQILYVEQDVQLFDNDTGSTTDYASLYLRNEAQLIQGGNSFNDGTGFISVYQNNPDSDAWDYTFWCSPVGNPSSGTWGNKAFGVENRVFDVVNITDSNITGMTNSYDGTQSPLTISRRWIYKYANGWSGAGTGNAIPPGRGFTMKGVGYSNHDQVYDFRGRPNTGDLTVPIYPSGYTLSGNPYPSALDLNKVFHDNSGQINSFRFWDEDHSINSHYYVDNQGGYASWTPASGSYDASQTNPGLYVDAMFMNYDNAGNATTSAGSGASYDRRFAPIGQGFMLYGEPAASGTITIDNSQRAYKKESVAGDFSDFRSSGAASATDVPVAEDHRVPHLKINTYFDESHMRQLILALSDEATDGYDRGFDAISPMDASSEAYFPIGEEQTRKPYVIQAVRFDMGKIVPITFELEEEMRVVLTAIEEVKITHDAFLFDNVLNTYQQITGDRTADVLLPAGEYSNRFFIVFRNEQRAQEEIIENTRSEVLSNVEFFQNNPAQQLEVTNPEGYNIRSASIFGMSGKLVYSKDNLGNSSRLTFPTGNLSDGIYLVMLTTEENIAVNYKITVKNN